MTFHFGDANDTSLNKINNKLRNYTKKKSKNCQEEEKNNMRNFKNMEKAFPSINKISQSSKSDTSVLS